MIHGWSDGRIASAKLSQPPKLMAPCHTEDQVVRAMTDMLQWANMSTITQAQLDRRAGLRQTPCQTRKASEAPRTEELQGPDGQVNCPVLGDRLARNAVVAGHELDDPGFSRRLRTSHAPGQSRREVEDDRRLPDLRQVPVDLRSGAPVEHVLGHARDGRQGQGLGAPVG
jgi:hypothetical protein